MQARIRDLETISQLFAGAAGRAAEAAFKPVPDRPGAAGEMEDQAAAAQAEEPAAATCWLCWPGH